MVSRNYKVQSDKKTTTELFAKNPHGSFDHGNTSNRSVTSNIVKAKQNIYYKQTSVGTQYSSPQVPSAQENTSPKGNHRYTYSAAKPKTDKSSVIPTYTSIVSQDLCSKIDFKSLTPLPEGTASYTFTTPNNDSNYNESSSQKQRINCVDSHFSSNTGSFANSSTDTFSVQGYKIRIPLTNVSPNNVNTNNNLPTIAESVVEDTEYPVDVQHYGYAAKDAKCSRNATLKCRDGADEGSECYCIDHTPYGSHRNGRFQYISDRPREMSDSMKGNNKYKYQGTHPDSLYRVAQLGGPESGGGGGRWTNGAARVRGPLRLLRWPLALAAVCIALALLVYFLMPETTPILPSSDGYNSTEWLHSEGQSTKDFMPDTMTPPPDKEHTTSNLIPDKMSVKSLENGVEKEKDELTFGYADDDNADDEGLQRFVELISASGLHPNLKSKLSPTTVSAPVFPANLSPSVQYGNEHEDAESNEKRNQKKPLAPHPVTDIYDNKFLTQTFAIFYNKDALESTTAGSEESVEKDDDKFNGEGPDISKPNIDKGVQAMHSVPGFTSGHQNSFGIPIEEAVKIKSTTQSAVYNTRVSPTLPSMLGRNKVRSTTVRSRWNTTEDGICFSTRLSMCRGVLPYDLTTQPLVGGARLLEAAPLLQLLLRSGCSPRARQFLCSLLEPECRPRGMKVLPPCRPACDEIANSCRDVISAATPELSAVFDCAQYPAAGGECAPQRGAGGGPARDSCPPGELRCALDGSCVPSHWRCDSINDCPGGTDEQGCDEGCAPNEFRCGDQSSCIPEEWTCDGHADCPGGGEDELGCGEGDGQDGADVLGAASQHPRPARLPRPSRYQATTIQTTTDFPVTVTSKSTMEYESSKELLMMSDSVQPKMKPLSALTGRKKASVSSSTTPRIIRVTSASSSVSVHRTSPCANGDPDCRRPPTRVPLCASGNCTEEKKMNSSEGYNITQKIEEMESISGLTSHSSPCPQGELRCVDGRCITLEQLCDHHTDCTDGADEANCFA